MFERFTDRARHVLVFAQEEARLLDHSFIGTEHVLLGLIREGEGLAAKALEALNISLDDVRCKVRESVDQGETRPTGSPPFTPRAKKVLELALREALQLGHNYIGTEHILLGLIREGEGVGAKVLKSLGADLAMVRQKVVELLSGYQDRFILRTKLLDNFDPEDARLALNIAVIVASEDEDTPFDISSAYSDAKKAVIAESHLSGLLLDILATVRHEPIEKTAGYIRHLLDGLGQGEDR